MKSIVTALAVATLGLFAFGCTPSPEKTCEHLQKLADEDNAKKMTGEKPFNLSMEKCIANMNEMKERDPEAYKCTAKTVKALSHLDTAFLAISVCDKNAPKKSKGGDDGEKTEKASKKKADD